MIYVTYILYVIYTISVFYYLTKIFGTPRIKTKNIFIVVLINSFLVYFPIYISNFQFEWLFMILYLLVLGIEIMLVLKEPYLKSVTALLCFIINYFGVRVLVAGTLAYNGGISINELFSQQHSRILITAITFFILSPYIYVSSRILISKVVMYVFADKESLKLSMLLLASVCFLQIGSMPSLYSEISNSQISNLYHIKTSILALLSFIIIMLIVYIYSKLKKASIMYKKTSDVVKTENSTIDILEKEAKIDYFTGFYIRSVAIDKLKEFIDLNVYCYIVYLDLDGLKTVNDNAGHEEGDWYIKEASLIIKNLFSDDTISRIGGDEFLIVGNSISPLTIIDKVDICENDISNLQKIHSKNYETSISYGINEIDETNKLSYLELINQTDKKMYLYKKARNKERKK